MIRIATLADERFRNRCANLSTSLERSQNDYELTIYCSDALHFDALRSERCRIVEIPQMSRLGPNRTKFTAVSSALQEGSTIYLDADAIVLENLDELWGGDQILGVHVDLRLNSRGEDPERPWPNDPTLINRRYMMGGGFFVPASRFEFFEIVRQASLDDWTWRKYTGFGSLDQRFLNAFINLYDEPIRWIDPEVYGWEGLLKNGQVQVDRAGSHLINRNTRKTLKIVLFGGIQQEPQLIRSLPLEVGSLLFERIVPGTPSVDYGIAQIQAAISPALSSQGGHSVSFQVLELILADIPRLEGRPDGTYFSKPEAIKDFACAVPPRDHTWNSLPCGGCHFDAVEYGWIRKRSRELGISTVLTPGEVEPPGNIDLLLLKHFPGLYPPGWATQLIQRFQPRYVLYANAFRNSAGIFQDQSRHGLQFIDSLDSARGLVLFGLLPQSRQAASAFATFDPATVVESPKVSIEIVDVGAIPTTVGASAKIRIKLTNGSLSALSSSYNRPVHVSYHWAAHDGAMIIREGRRTSLPFDLEPGDTAEFPINVDTPEHEGIYRLQVTLVQEHLFWFDTIDPQSVCSAPPALFVSIVAGVRFKGVIDAENVPAGR